VTHKSVRLNPVVASPLKLKIAPPNALGVVFIGSAAHKPNADGITWFLKNSWGSIRNIFPDAILHIIGGDKDSVICSAANATTGVVFHGYVEDISGIISQCKVGVAPLLSGAGVKGKVLTYLSYGLSVVSTMYGLQGLPNIAAEPFVAETDVPDSFSSSICHFLSLSEEQRLHNAKKAQSYMTRNFSEGSLIKQLKQGLEILGIKYKPADTFAKYRRTSLDIECVPENSLLHYRQNYSFMI
jgi:hypothetical protein